MELRKRLGDVYTMVMLGRVYCKIHNPKDVEALYHLPDKKASLLEAYMDLAGPTLPKPARSKAVETNPRMKVLLDPFKNSGTLLMAQCTPSQPSVLGSRYSRGLSAATG